MIMEQIKGCKDYFPPIYNSFHTWQQPCESRVRYDVGGTMYGEYYYVVGRVYAEIGIVGHGDIHSK